jgi:hypothetical protein
MKDLAWDGQLTLSMSGIFQLLSKYAFSGS